MIEVKHIKTTEEGKVVKEQYKISSTTGAKIGGYYANVSLLLDKDQAQELYKLLGDKLYSRKQIKMPDNMKISEIRVLRGGKANFKNKEFVKWLNCFFGVHYPSEPFSQLETTCFRCGKKI